MHTYIDIKYKLIVPTCATFQSLQAYACTW